MNRRIGSIIERSNDGERFSLAVLGIIGKRLTFKDLTGLSDVP